MRRVQRLGVAGLGPAGQLHAANIATLPTARLHAVASRRPGVAGEFARRHDVARAYTEYADLFADGELDAVVIASAGGEHPDHIRGAARHGRHIFTEKPIGFTLESIDQAVAAVRDAGVHLQVGFMRRFDPGYAQAKRKIEEGAIGRPVLFRANSRDPFFPEKQGTRGYNTTFLDLAVHDFDLARWLMGSEVREVYATGAALVYPSLRDAGDVDNAVVSLTFETGAVGTVDLSRNARYGYDVRAEIVGDEGALLVGELRQTPLVNLSKSGATHDVFSWYPERFAQAFAAEMAAFVEALQTERAPSPDGWDGRCASEISHAAADSWRTGKPVILSHARA